MAKDFFGSLTDTFAKAAKDLTGRAETIYETQKLKNKISGEERQIEKAMADLGRIVYRRYQEGIPVEEAEDAICVQIDERYQQIERLKKEAEDLKEQRTCPNCGNIVGKNDAFCSKCGASCPVPEEEDDNIVDMEEPEEEASEEVEEPAEETASEEEKEEEVIPEWKPEEHACGGVSLEKPTEEKNSEETSEEEPAETETKEPTESEEAPAEVPESATTEEAE